MKRKLVLFTLLIFSVLQLFAAPGPVFHKKGHKNFHGKRMLEEDDKCFVLFIKATEFPDCDSFKIVFSQPVNPESINDENFLLNENKIYPKKIMFSKNYRIIDFIADFDDSVWLEENNELIVKDIESISGNKIEPVIIKNFQIEKDFKLMKKLKD